MAEMPTDTNAREDEIIPQLNPDADEPNPGENLPQPRKRPAKSASASEWVDYCVDLGADRGYLESTTTHAHDALDDDGRAIVEFKEHPGLTVKELIALADKLGG